MNELGFATFFLNGPTTSGIVGLGGYFAHQVAESIFLRPELGVGNAPASALHVTFAAARLDTCWRIPPEDPVHAAVQFDLCGGADAGFTYVASGTAAAPQQGRTLPYFDVEASADLRSTIGSDMAVTLRGGGGVNVLHASYVDSTGVERDAPPASLRFELAIAWLFR